MGVVVYGHMQAIILRERREALISQAGVRSIIARLGSAGSSGLGTMTPPMLKGSSPWMVCDHAVPWVWRAIGDGDIEHNGIATRKLPELGLLQMAIVGVLG